MTEQEIEDYFLNMATIVKDIAHTNESKAFYRMKDPMDLDEFDNAVRNMAKPVCLILEMGDGAFGEYDSPREDMRIGLHVLVKTTESFAAINTARDFAKEVIIKIVKQMRYDCQDQYTRADGVPGPLKVKHVIFDSQVKYSNMTAIDGNWYGKSGYLSFKPTISLVRNPNDYLS